MRGLGEALGGAPACFLPHARGLGPVRVDPAAVLRRAIDTANGRSEEFFLCSEDGQAGLVLLREDQCLAAMPDGEPCPYELVIWGEAWRREAVRHLPFALSRAPQPEAVRETRPDPRTRSPLPPNWPFG